jgi:hypothetical protein
MMGEGMKTTHRRPLAGAAALTTALVLALGTSPAMATDFDPPPADNPSGPPASDSPSSTSDPYSSSGPSYGTVSNCSVVSTPNFLGVSCGNGAGEGQTVKEYFGAEGVKDLPGCSHKAPDASELAGLSYENTPGPEGSTWYWEYCLVDPKLGEQVRQAEISVSIVWIRNDAKVEKDDKLNALADLRQGTVPFPVAVPTPSTQPRVGAWTSFVDGTDDHVTVETPTVTLDAHVVGVTVKPLGRDARESVSCPGTGYHAERGDSPSTTDVEACWWQYSHSSSGQPMTTSEGQPAYPVEITATWAVDTIVGGVRSRFNTFQKSQVTPLPVTEIQALVVS